MHTEQDIYDEFEKEADLSDLGGDFNVDESTEEAIDGESESSIDESNNKGGDSVDGKEESGSSGDDANTGDDKGASNDESGRDSKESTGDGQGGDEHRTERDPVIPRARFDAVNKRLTEEREAREALEARIQELEGRGQQEKPQKGEDNTDKTEPIDLIEKEREYAEALVNDDYDTAGKIRAEINAEIKRQATEESVQQYRQQQTRDREQAEAEKQQDLLNQAADDVANAYPELNMAAETGDQAKVDEVVQWRNFLITSERMPAHEALRVAAKRVLGDPVKDNGGGQQQNNKRQQNAINRGFKDSESQPPTNQDGIGARAAGFESPGPEDQEAWERTPDKEREKLLQ